MHPMEEIITEALLGTTDKETAMCRVSCNAVASQQMFCSCDRVLGQEKVVVCTVKTPKRRVVQGFCLDCWDRKQDRIFEAAKVTQTPILVEGWSGVIFKQGEVD